MKDSEHVPGTSDPKPACSADRRRALVRLGLAVGAAYLAPTVLSIDRSARAMGPSCAKNPANC
ncbi:hypothetical protein [Thalassobaculum sp.]|uniref:hypothetical protein n=1 Tax=Thalassobaculum sp. TaxID=2022740 RepID=UPI0032EBFAC1